MKVQSFLIKSKCFGCGVNGTNTKLNHYKCVGYYKKKIMVAPLCKKCGTYLGKQAR